jgi:hypothetical protein
MVGTAAGAQKMKDLGRWQTVPKLGDLCFMDFPNDNLDRISHIGIVAKVGLKSVLCIEGNTSGSGDQRNGGMVMIKERFLGKEIVGFARPKFVEYAGEFPVVQLLKAAKKEKKK